MTPKQAREVLNAPAGATEDELGRAYRAAVKAAAMCEEVARTVHMARQGGAVHPIDQPDIDSLYDRYQNAYGQH